MLNNGLGHLLDSYYYAVKKRLWRATCTYDISIFATYAKNWSFDVWPQRHHFSWTSLALVILPSANHLLFLSNQRSWMPWRGHRQSHSNDIIQLWKYHNSNQSVHIRKVYLRMHVTHHLQSVSLKCDHYYWDRQLSLPYDYQCSANVSCSSISKVNSRWIVHLLEWLVHLAS